MRVPIGRVTGISARLRISGDVAARTIRVLSEGKAHEAITPLSELDVDLLEQQRQTIVERLCRMPCLDFDHLGGEQQPGCDLLAYGLFKRSHHAGAVDAQ